MMFKDIMFAKDGNDYSMYLLNKEDAYEWWGEEQCYSVIDSYEFYKDYNRTRENIDEVDWDMVSVKLDYADIDFIREFKDYIRWDLVNTDTFCKWKHNKDPRYLEFRNELENTEITNQTIDNEWLIDKFMTEVLIK